MGRVVIIVQARMASTRLPGKVLRHLAGETVLAHVLRRCGAIQGGDVVCCAVPEGADCEAVAEEAKRCGAIVFRGSESDVLDRYHRAAVACGADVVMRVTSDCPLIDPEVCSRVLELRANEEADYACNNMPPSWPHGLDCEVFTAAALARAHREASSPAEREHVTPWLRRHPDIRRANLTCPEPEQAGQRWTLDYAADYRFMAALFARLPATGTGWRTVVGAVAADAELDSLQAACRRPVTEDA